MIIVNTGVILVHAVVCQVNIESIIVQHCTPITHFIIEMFVSFDFYKKYNIFYNYIVIQMCEVNVSSKQSDYLPCVFTKYHNPG